VKTAKNEYSEIQVKLDAFFDEAEQAVGILSVTFPTNMEIRKDPEAPQKALSAHGKALLDLSEWVVRIGQYQLRIRGLLRNLEGAPFEVQQAYSKDLNFRYSLLSDLRKTYDDRKWDVYHSMEALRTIYSGEIKIAAMG